MPTRYLKPGICDSEAIDKCSSSSERLLQLCNAEKGLSKLSIVVPEIHNKDVA